MAASSTSFKPENDFGKRPRKRKVLSETLLRASLERSGASALHFLEDTFKDGAVDLKHRLSAVNIYMNLVFIKPKEDEVEQRPIMVSTPELLALINQEQSFEQRQQRIDLLKEHKEILLKDAEETAVE